MLAAHKFVDRLSFKNWIKFSVMLCMSVILKFVTSTFLFVCLSNLTFLYCINQVNQF